MARLPYLEADQVAPEYRDMLKRNTNLHKLLVNSPDMARAFNGVGSYIRFKSKLDPRLRELAILQVGWLERSEYEFTHHVKIGKEFGVTDEDIAGLIADTEGKSSKLEPLAKAILRGAREMVRELAMSEATFAEIRKDLSDAHMTDPSVAKAAHGGIRVLAFMKNAPGHLHKRLTRHRSVRLLAEALDQLHAETPFEFTNLQADCRLCQVEMARSRRKAAALDYFEQGAQLIEVEAAHPKWLLSK